MLRPIGEWERLATRKCWSDFTDPFYKRTGRCFEHVAEDRGRHWCRYDDEPDFEVMVRISDFSTIASEARAAQIAEVLEWRGEE